MPIQRYETAPSEQGILITNPPYGERISSSDLFGLYESIGNRLKHVFKGTMHGSSVTIKNASIK